MVGELNIYDNCKLKSFVPAKEPQILQPPVCFCDHWAFWEHFVARRESCVLTRSTTVASFNHKNGVNVTVHRDQFKDHLGLLNKNINLEAIKFSPIEGSMFPGA